MKERRRYPRYESALEVRYSTAKNASPADYTVSKDISKSGIRIPCFDFVKKGKTIYLDIDLKSGKPSFSTAARVIWTKKSKRDAPLKLEAGLEFTKADLKEIESIINRISL